MLRKTLLLICTGLGLSAVSAFAHGDMDEEGIISYRHGVMKAASGHLSAAKYILTKNLELKGHLQKHADALADIGPLIPDMFPEGSDFGDTDAKPEVWEKWDEFVKKAEAYDQAAKAFAANPTKVTFGEVGESCKSCHKAFREK